LDKAKEEGSHWTCAFIKNNQVNYFDSYGNEPKGKIEEFFKEFPKFTRNKYPYQSIISDVCGQYCIVFLYYLSQGYSYEYFLKKLYTSKNSDLFVKNIVNKMLK
jgi:Ulp1 family protease